MEKKTTTIKVGYQNRNGRTHDLPTVPKLILANQFLANAGFLTGCYAEICYCDNEIIIKKLT